MDPHSIEHTDTDETSSSDIFTDGGLVGLFILLGLVFVSVCLHQLILRYFGDRDGGCCCHYPLPRDALPCPRGCSRVHELTSDELIGMTAACKNFLIETAQVEVENPADWNKRSPFPGATNEEIKPISDNGASKESATDHLCSYTLYESHITSIGDGDSSLIINPSFDSVSYKSVSKMPQPSISSGKSDMMRDVKNKSFFQSQKLPTSLRDIAVASTSGTPLQPPVPFGSYQPSEDLSLLKSVSQPAIAYLSSTKHSDSPNDPAVHSTTLHASIENDLSQMVQKADCPHQDVLTAPVSLPNILLSTNNSSENSTAIKTDTLTFCAEETQSDSSSLADLSRRSLCSVIDNFAEMELNPAFLNTIPANLSANSGPSGFNRSFIRGPYDVQTAQPPDEYTPLCEYKLCHSDDSDGPMSGDEKSPKM